MNFNEPANVYKVHPDAHNVNYAAYDRGIFETPATKTLDLHKFSNTFRIPHESYIEMQEQVLDRDYDRFYNGLVDNCKTLFVGDCIKSVYYDAMKQEDVASWHVRVGSEQIDYFKDLFKCQERHYDDLAVRTVEKKIYVPELPHTIRECLSQAWIIFKKRFRRK